MPAEFLSDDQVAVYGQFSGPISRAELERFFFLDDQDLELVGRRRDRGSRLGFGVQLGTLRFLGTFLDNPVAVPEVVVDFVATQLGIVDGSVLDSYVERSKTPYEHRWEIARAYGYRRFSEPGYHGIPGASWRLVRGRGPSDRPSSLTRAWRGFVRNECCYRV